MVDAGRSGHADPGRGDARAWHTEPGRCGFPAGRRGLPGFLDFMEGAALVGHNAPFDIRVLAHELLRAGLPLPDNPVLDTCAIPRRLHLDVPNHRLSFRRYASEEVPSSPLVALMRRARAELRAVILACADDGTHSAPAG